MTKKERLLAATAILAVANEYEMITPVNASCTSYACQGGCIGGTQNTGGIISCDGCAQGAVSGHGACTTCDSGCALNCAGGGNIIPSGGDSGGGSSCSCGSGCASTCTATCADDVCSGGCKGKCTDTCTGSCSYECIGCSACSSECKSSCGYGCFNGCTASTRGVALLLCNCYLTSLERRGVA